MCNIIFMRMNPIQWYRYWTCRYRWVVPQKIPLLQLQNIAWTPRTAITETTTTTQGKKIWFTTLLDELKEETKKKRIHRKKVLFHEMVTTAKLYNYLPSIFCKSGPQTDRHIPKGRSWKKHLIQTMNTKAFIGRTILRTRNASMW